MFGGQTYCDQLIKSFYVSNGLGLKPPDTGFQLAEKYYLRHLHMTRQKWTTKEQEEWLEERKSAFLEANQRRSAAKDFFPTIVKDFREKWPVMPVTQEEIQKAGSVELAERFKRERYDKVNSRMLCM